MEEIIMRDESVLTNSEKSLLNRTLEQLEQYFPEHKVFAFDALCSQHRKNALTFSKKLGYQSVEEFLNAYGFEIISGDAVYETRKDCGIIPGEEPELLKKRIDRAIDSLNTFYPDHVVDTAMQKDHKGLYMNLTGYWQWLGYRSLGDMLDAYGFSYSTQGHSQSGSKGGRSPIDVKAIMEELISRYEGDRYVESVDQLKDENPDLAKWFKTLQNKSRELFGTTFALYLKKQGVIQKYADIAERLATVVEELKKRYETKEPPEKLADLKADNKDIDGINNISTWIEKYHGKTAMEYFREIGLIKKKALFDDTKEAIWVDMSRNKRKEANKQEYKKPKAPSEPVIPAFTSSEDVEAFCIENFVPGLLAQFAKKIGVRESSFKGVRYKEFDKALPAANPEAEPSSVPAVKIEPASSISESGKDSTEQELSVNEEDHSSELQYLNNTLGKLEPKHSNTPEPTEYKQREKKNPGAGSSVSAVKIKPAPSISESGKDNTKQNPSVNEEDHSSELQYLKDTLSKLETKYSNTAKPTKYEQLEKENPEFDWKELRYVIANVYDVTARRYFREKGLIEPSR